MRNFFERKTQQLEEQEKPTSPEEKSNFSFHQIDTLIEAIRITQVEEKQKRLIRKAFRVYKTISDPRTKVGIGTKLAEFIPKLFEEIAPIWRTLKITYSKDSRNMGVYTRMMTAPALLQSKQISSEEAMEALQDSLTLGLERLDAKVDIVNLLPAEQQEAGL